MVVKNTPPPETPSSRTTAPTLPRATAAIKETNEEDHYDQDDNYTTFYCTTRRTVCSIGSAAIKELNEEDGQEDGQDDYYTTFFTTSRRTLSSIGSAGDSSSTYLNINVTQPSWILVDGGDVATMNSIMKQIVDVWVKLDLPVLVVAPHLETVSSHCKCNVGFYQFSPLTGAEDAEVISRCEEFLTSKPSLKLLVFNTTHHELAMNTNRFLAVLADHYKTHNVVVLTIAPPQDLDTLTGIIATSKTKLKRDTDSVLYKISQTLEVTLGPEVEKIKRGTLVSISLDEDDVQPVVFTSLFGK